MNQSMGQELGQQSHDPSAASTMFLDSSTRPTDQVFDLSKATHDAAIYYQQNRKKTSLEKVAKQFGTTVKRVRNRVKKLNENPTFNPNSFIVNAPSNAPPPSKTMPHQGSINQGKIKKPTKKQQQMQERQQELQREVQRQQSIVQQQVAAAQAANALGVVELSMHQATLDPSMIQLNGLGQSQPQQILQFQQLLALSLLLLLQQQQQQQQQQHHHSHHHQQQQQLSYQQQQHQPLQLLPHHGTIIDFNNLENLKALVNSDKLTIEEIKYVINYLINKALGQ